MPLFEQQWRLAYAGVEYLWGGIDPADPFKRWLGRGSNAEAPEWSDTELELETWGRPRQDGVGFGQDFRRGKTVTFQLIFKGAGSTNAATRAHASQLIADAERAWLAEDEAGERLAPGQLATLTTRYGGVERTIYGRPRKFTPIYATLASGQLRAVRETFDCASDTWFGDEESLRMDIARRPQRAASRSLSRSRIPLRRAKWSPALSSTPARGRHGWPSTCTGRSLTLS